MKKKMLAMFLTMTLAFTTLVGCGGGSQEESPSGDNSSVAETTNSDEANDTVKKSNTFSGYLSNEDTILYEVSAMDKSTTPKTVYFFKNGKVTIIPGDIVGLTLGELSNMSEGDIWASYDTYKTTYDEQEYVFYENNTLKWYKLALEGIDLLSKILEGVNVENISSEDTVLLREYWMVDSLNGVSNEELFQVCIKALSQEDVILEESFAEFVNIYGCVPEEYFYYNCEPFVSGDPIDDSVKDALVQYRLMVELAMNSCKYVSPLYEMPFTCVVETDATGNLVKTEKIIVPIWDAYEVKGSSFDLSTYSVSAIQITNQVEGGQIKIYDTTYNCYPLNTNSGALICTRASMRIDGVDSKGVLIDPTSEQINDLYKDITMSRFE